VSAQSTAQNHGHDEVSVTNEQNFSKKKGRWSRTLRKNNTLIFGSSVGSLERLEAVSAWELTARGFGNMRIPGDEGR
jgi:hypothetical protein